jgi:transcriptional regulator with XRE-family HTH domain
MGYDCSMYQAKSFSDRLHQARRDLRWDQNELAARSGISRGYISEIERGVKKNVGVEVVIALAAALGVTVPYLLGLSDDPLGEGNDKVLKEQSPEYVVFDVDGDTERRTLRALVDAYTALRPEHQRLALSYLRMMRQIEEEETRGAADTPPPHIIGDQ